MQRQSMLIFPVEELDLQWTGLSNEDVTVSSLM
jgi:hypothetical protein